MRLTVVSSGSVGNCYILEAKKKLVLDAGIKYKDIVKALDYNIMDVDGALLTHEHLDHVRSADELVKNGIPTYGCDELQTQIHIRTGELIKCLPELKKAKIGEYVVTPFYLPHTTRNKETGKIVRCPNFGYLIEHPEIGRLLYATDMQYIPYNFQKLKINHLLIECNHMIDLTDRDAENFEHRLRGHCSLKTYLDIIRTNQTSELVSVTAIHLSEESCSKEKVLEATKEVVGINVTVNVATKGLQINL